MKVDVIVGGHTHELIKDIKEGENLFYSANGEPIILTEAGRDGKAFGLLNLTFDKNGGILENSLKPTTEIIKSGDFSLPIYRYNAFECK